MKTYIIAEDQRPDANGCTEADYAPENTIIIARVTPRGRRLLAQEVDPDRIVELGEATRI